MAQAEFTSAFNPIRAPERRSLLGNTQKQLDELHIALVKPEE